MATKRIVARALCAGWAAVALALAGCGAADDALSGFAGGTSSKDKKDAQIPSMVQSSANAQPEATTQPPTPPGAPQIGAPTPATKDLMTSAPAAETAEKSATEVAVAPAPSQSLRSEAQAYTATRNRDPFRSLISSDQDRTNIVDLSVVTLVGVVWAHPRPFCIVEDAEGISYVLRKGDRVKNGRVTAVHRDKLVASQTILGYTTTVQLTLDKEKGRTHG